MTAAQPSSSHKFGIGQAVIFTPAAGEVFSATITKCTITRLLPKEGAEYQYHIRNAPDGQVRRAWESQLQPV